MSRVTAWAFGLGLLTVPSLSHGQNTKDQQREAPEVRRLDIKGVRHVDLHDLSNSISTQASRCRSLLLEPFCVVSHSPTFFLKHYLNEDEFRRDVLRIRLYYWKRGYRDATVDTSVVKSGADRVHVTFAVHENEPTRVRKIAIVYDSTLQSFNRASARTLVSIGVFGSTMWS